jgi:hypothetical protein
MTSHLQLVRELIACGKINEAYVLFARIGDVPYLAVKDDKWPHQTNKQALGAQLFFPQELNDLFDTGFIFDCKDVLIKLSYAASFRDPVSCYVLSVALRDHLLPEIRTTKTKFVRKCINKLVDKVKRYLEIDNPHIFSYAWLKYMVDLDISYLRDMALTTVCDIRAIYHYAHVADSYGGNNEERKELYQRAYDRGYKRALLHLAQFSQTAEECFQIHKQATEEGVVEAYYQMGNMILNKGYRQESIEKGISYLNKATKSRERGSAFYTLKKYYLRKGHDMAKYEEWEQEEDKNSILAITGFGEKRKKEILKWYVNFFHKICDIHIC